MLTHVYATFIKILLGVVLFYGDGVDFVIVVGGGGNIFINWGRGIRNSLNLPPPHTFNGTTLSYH